MSAIVFHGSVTFLQLYDNQRRNLSDSTLKTVLECIARYNGTRLTEPSAADLLRVPHSSIISVKLYLNLYSRIYVILYYRVFSFPFLFFFNWLLSFSVCNAINT